MNTPDAAAVRSWSPAGFDWADYGYPVADPDPLERPAAIGGAMFLKITGRNWGSITASNADCPQPLAEYAVWGLTLLNVAQAQPDYLETLADWDLIQSFGAGSYNETRRSAEDALKARLIVAWPWLSNLLWDLLTPERQDYYNDLLGGPNTPAFDVTEVDWSPLVDWSQGGINWAVE